MLQWCNRIIGTWQPMFRSVSPKTIRKLCHFRCFFQLNKISEVLWFSCENRWPLAIGNRFALREFIMKKAYVKRENRRLKRKRWKVWWTHTGPYESIDIITKPNHPLNAFLAIHFSLRIRINYWLQVRHVFEGLSHHSRKFQADNKLWLVH